MPASWGLVGAAYDEAEAYYTLRGEELDRRLVDIRYKGDALTIKKKNLDIDFAYNKISAYSHATTLNEWMYEDLEKRCFHQIDIDIEHGKMSPYDGEAKKAETLYVEGVERDLAMLEIDFKFDRIAKNVYEKRRATLKSEPWVAFVDSGFNPDQGIDGVFFELDWNPQWVEFLKLHGFVGHSEEQIVEDWFSEVCRSYSQPGPAVSVLPTYPMGFDSRDI